MSIRFGEFCKVVDGRITTVFTLLDVVGLMSQAGWEVLPPSNGEDIPVPGPSRGGAVLLESQDDDLSRQSLETLEGMLFKGMNYRTAHSGGSMQGYWVDDMVWYGQKGIGSARGLENFTKNIQGPIVAAHPDRIGGFHLARIAEGECAAMCGLETLQVPA